jgi:Protease subunit of ATP-dependent Clp proteases
MRQIISHHSGQPYDKVARDTDRDYYLTSEKAQEYGLIDKVLSSSDEKDKNKKDKK